MYSDLYYVQLWKHTKGHYTEKLLQILCFLDSDFCSYTKESIVLCKSVFNIIANLLKALPASALSQAVVYLSLKHFCGANFQVTNSKGKGKKPTNGWKLAADVKAVIDYDAQVIIQEISSTLDTISGSVSKILKLHLGYRKVCDWWVHQILMLENRVWVAFSRSIPPDICCLWPLGVWMRFLQVSRSGTLCEPER